MGMTRYEFLARAHALCQPRTYLEIGVQFGGSLALAEAAEIAAGIDPTPMVRGDLQRPNQVVYQMTADEFFTRRVDVLTAPPRGIDFAFIDGSHLFEDALRDFLNVERYLTNGRSVVFLDDVLPYSSAIAARVQPPGDWTGDVWRIIDVLEEHRPDLDLTLIDVSPTGLLMVHSEYWPHRETPKAVMIPGEALEFAELVAATPTELIVAHWGLRGEGPDSSVPDDILNRTYAVTPERALEILERY
jgi:predicted O-methyltransferase YrrM